MRVLVIGGARHAEWVDDLLDTQRVWVDLRNATSHVIRKIKWIIQDIATGEAAAVYDMIIAVHPDLIGPNEPAVVGELLKMIATNEFVRANGTEIVVPDTVEGLIVPGQNGGSPT